MARFNELWSKVLLGGFYKGLDGLSRKNFDHSSYDFMKPQTLRD